MFSPKGLSSILKRSRCNRFSGLAVVSHAQHTPCVISDRRESEDFVWDYSTPSSHATYAKISLSNRDSSLVWLADSVLCPLASLIALLFVGISCRIFSGYPCGKLSLLYSFFVVFLDASEFSEVRCYPFPLRSECSFWVSGQSESSLPTYSTAPSSSTIWASFAVSQFLCMALWKFTSERIQTKTWECCMSSTLCIFQS